MEGSVYSGHGHAFKMIMKSCVPKGVFSYPEEMHLFTVSSVLYKNAYQILALMETRIFNHYMGNTECIIVIQYHYSTVVITRDFVITWGHVTLKSVKTSLRFSFLNQKVEVIKYSSML